MIQPIFAISKNKVKEIVEHQSKLTQIPYHFEWGRLKSKEELFEKLDNEATEFGCIRMYNLHLCFQAFETQKMTPGVNRMIKRVLALCKEYRQDLKKISVEQ